MKKGYLIIFAILFLGSSCKKYLDLKSDKSLVIPSSTEDLQGLLDNPANNNIDPASGVLAGGFIYLLDNTYNATTVINKDTYSWSASAVTDPDWQSNYQKILFANTVLDNIDKVTFTQQSTKDYVQGQAYFARAYTHFKLSQVYTPPYAPATAGTDPGLPLKLSSDINEPTTRATVKATFEQIIKDYKAAATFLPAVSVPLTRPSKAAAFAGLAEALLITGDYQQAEIYADSALKLNSSLLDFNTLNTSATNPIPLFNTEVLFQSQVKSNSVFSRTNSKVDSVLYKSYTDDDLRKSAFYKKNADGSYYFKGSFDGNLTNGRFFSGLANDEVYLIKAECQARAGKATEAYQTLNLLLAKRYNAQTFVPLDGAAEQALPTILAERKKELAFRGDILWQDLRRLNLDPAYKTDLSRTILGQIYTLPAGDKRYAFLIPQSVITLSGIAQNPR